MIDAAGHVRRAATKHAVRRSLRESECAKLNITAEGLAKGTQKASRERAIYNARVYVYA